MGTHGVDRSGGAGGSGATQNYTPVTDVFDGDSTTVAFTLTVAPGSASALVARVSGVVQTPGVDFTVSSNVITFTTAPASGTDNIVVQNFGVAWSVATVAGSAITGLTSDLVTFDQSGSGAVEESLQSRGRWVIYATDYMSAAMRADIRAGTAAVDCSSGITAAMTYAATLVPTVGTYVYGSVWVVLPAGLIKCNVTIPAGVELVCLTGIAVLVANATGVVVDTTIYDSGNTPHRNGGLRNVHIYGLGAGTACVGLRQNNTHNFVLEHARFYNLADQAWQIITNASGGTATAITCYAHDVRAYNCLLDTTRADRDGVFEISGTDHEFYSCEAFSVSTRTLSGSKRCVGWLLTGVTASHFSRCRADYLDQAWYMDSNTGLNTFEACKGVNTFAEGFEVHGFRNVFTDFRVDSASLDTTNTYDAFTLGSGSAHNVLASGIISNDTTTAKSPRYGITDAGNTAASPNVISPLVRVLAGATGKVNYSGGTTYFASPNRVLAKSAAAQTAPVDTNENTLATITVPANAMGPNGAIRGKFQVTHTNGADDKTIRVRFSGAAGTILLQDVRTTTGLTTYEFMLLNAEAANSQKFNANGWTGNVTFLNVTQSGTAAIDTTADTTLVITAQKETSGDTITLDWYFVELVSDLK